MEAVLLGMVLMLSIFLGFELISKVPATLHTPLMSGANAISGITIVGALISAGSELNEFATILGSLAVGFPFVMRRLGRTWWGGQVVAAAIKQRLRVHSIAYGE